MFKKNTATVSPINEISDLLAKIHIEIQKEQILQEKHLPLKKNVICRLRELFTPPVSLSDRIRLLELCRDFLRNNTTIPAKYLDRIFANAPSDIKAIYNQVKNFSEQDKNYGKQIFNEHGYITSDFIKPRKALNQS